MTQRFLINDSRKQLGGRSFSADLSCVPPHGLQPLRNSETPGAAPFSFSAAGLDSASCPTIAKMNSPNLRFFSSSIAKTALQSILNSAPSARQRLAQRLSAGKALQKSRERRRRGTSFSLLSRMPQVTEEPLP